MKSTKSTRKRVVKLAVANETLEGLKVSPDSIKIANEYVAGKITVSQAAKKIRARYGAI